MTDVTERGILFKPWLIDAIERGRKTETRRLSMRLAKLKKGDVLWVREKLVAGSLLGSRVARYARDGQVVLHDGNAITWRWERDWLSPLHMPREAARLLLRLVKDARVERVDDIDGDGARREGVSYDGAVWWFAYKGRFSAREAFLAAWSELHPTVPLDAKVVVLRFERVEVTP